MLVAEAVHVFPIQSCIKGVVARRDGALMHMVVARWILDLSQMLRVSFHAITCCASNAIELSGLEMLLPPSCVKGKACAYPEIDLEIATASKLPIANLERDRHLVVFV